MNLKEIYRNFQAKKAEFIELTRAYSLPISMAPWFVAVAYASVSHHFYSDTVFKLFSTFLTFAAIICIHLGSNLFDDFIDVKRELKKGISLDKINFENAKNKARLIRNGAYSLSLVKKIIGILFGVGILTGIFFTSIYGWIIPAFAVVSGLLCLIYPISSRFGLSEIIIGIIFGPLLMMGTYFSLTGDITSTSAERLFILSIAVALIITVLLNAHSLMDFDYDKNKGKHTLCNIIGGKNGDKKRALGLIFAQIILAYAIMIYLAVSGQFAYWILLPVLLTAPLSAKLIISLNDYNNVKDLKFIPKWYLGPMENWDMVQKEGYEYFMYRFYIARNIGFIFCIVLAFVLFFTVETNYIYI